MLPFFLTVGAAGFEPVQSGRPDLNRRPHGPEPSGLKPLPRTSRIPVFANHVVSTRWVTVWTTVVFLRPSLVLFSPGF